MKISIQSVFKEHHYLDQTITMQGWIRTRRDSKAGFSFLQLNDGSCFDSLQIIVPNTVENYQTEVLHLTAGCSVQVVGKIVASQGKGQSVEMQAEIIQVIGWVESPDNYPIQPKAHSMEFLRQVAHLRPRTNTFGAVTRIRHQLAMAIHQFFSERHFSWISTPILTASDCEGAGELFRVSTLDQLNLPKTEKGAIDHSQDFFGQETFLTVSGQLNVETHCCALSNVYTFGPTFRAENSNTARHLAEFWMVEPEIAFADLNDNIKLAQDLLQHLSKHILDQSEADLAFFQKRVDTDCIKRLTHLATTDFQIIDYTDAITLLEKATIKFEYPVQWGLDLQSEHERYLTENHFGKPVVVINYPKDIKGFYMRLNDDQKTVAAMDVLVPGIGELIGGSQREERLDILEQRMTEMSIDLEHYAWYRDLRRYGTVPHAGFGLGFERLISYVTGLKNVRDVIPFPRTPGSVEY